MGEAGEHKVRYTKHKDKTPKLVSVIGDEDTCTGFLLAGIGEVDKNRNANFFVVEKNTPKDQIEDAFKHFVKHPEIHVVLINKFVADKIRQTVDSFDLPTPAVLEIPSRDFPYDPDKDPILKRARTRFYSEETEDNKAKK